MRRKCRSWGWGPAALLTSAALLASSGCGVLTGGLRGTPLPGGADLGDHPYTVTIQFADVGDLVPQSLVKVNDVSVGAVQSISVDPATWHAVVVAAVNGDVTLPHNATASVSTTSLLGEKFVSLATPATGAQGRLAQGDTIPLSASGRGVEVEEVLGALSMLLNGGGVAQLKTISTELNNALKGNEPEIRSLLANLNTLVGNLDRHKSDITRALDGLNRLSATLNARRGQITTALDDLAPGLEELDRQRGELVDLLKSLDRLSAVATNVVNRSHDDVLADLRALRPTLSKLAESGQDLPNSLQLLGSFPFTDAAQQAVAGDYANLYVSLDLDLQSLLDNLTAGTGLAFPGPDSPLFRLLPPTAQVLSPLIGGSAPAAAPAFPVIGAVPLVGGGSPATGATATPTPTPAPTTTATPPSVGGLIGGLLGGGR